MARGHGTEPRDEGMEEGSCIFSNEIFILPATKGATIGPAFVPFSFCLCVFMYVCQHALFNNLKCFGKMYLVFCAFFRTAQQLVMTVLKTH